MEELRIHNGQQPLLIDEHVPAFCAALQAARLTRLLLSNMRLWQTLDAAVQPAAVCSHRPSLLKELILSGNNCETPEEQLAAGEALASIVAAGSPLETLDISSCNLGDASARLLYEALSRSITLRTLNCGLLLARSLGGAALAAAYRSIRASTTIDAAQVQQLTLAAYLFTAHPKVLAQPPECSSRKSCRDTAARMAASLASPCLPSSSSPV